MSVTFDSLWNDYCDAVSKAKSMGEFMTAHNAYLRSWYALRAACHMSDETGEREDVTVDDQGAIVNSIDYLVVQPGDRTRETYEAWRKKEEAKRRVP